MSFAEFYADDLLAILGVKPDDPDLAAKEAAAEKALAFAMSLVESYLDRGLEYVADEVEVFTPPTSRALLRRYPVEAIDEIAWPPWGGYAGGTWPVETYRADLARGIVYLGNWGWAVGQVSIAYAGGYKEGEYPEPLLAALMALAASLYPGIYETGLPVPNLAPNIKQLTMPDVGTVEFNGAGGGDGGSAVMGYGEISSAHMGALDRYRAESIVGVG